MSDSLKEKNSSDRLKTALNSKYIVLAFFTLLILLTSQCASIQQPTGGPLDSIPPKILSETPANLSVNFDAEEVVIAFDEFIKLEKEFEEISISPEMPTRPLFKVNRRDLEITIPDSLEENTTYTINFGKSLVDFNESNPLPDYSYVFSTGPVLDSLSVSGHVTDAFTLENAKETTVMLIPTSRDSIFGKLRANIFTITDSSGNFSIRNLREDSYDIYALHEKNNDRVYNASEELIGFLNDSFYLDKDTSGIELMLSRGIPTDFRLLDRKIDADGKLLFAFNKSLSHPRIEIQQPKELDNEKIVAYNQTTDTALVWLPELTFDSLKVYIYNEEQLLDSVSMRRGRNEEYDRDFDIMDRLNGNRVNRVKHVRLVANAPVSSVDRSKIILTQDSVPITNYQLIKDTAGVENFSYLLRYNWRPEVDYNLTIEPGGFHGYFDTKNKPYDRSFTYDGNALFGNITFTVTPPDTTHQYIVELVREKKDVVYQSTVVTAQGPIPFRQLPGGKYTLRIIYDTNNNGKWDPGNVTERTQPERIWYIGKTIIVRANWDQEEAITIPK